MATIYIEGGAAGPHSKALNAECREAFSKLLQKCGFRGRMPALVACEGRANAFRDFARKVRGSQDGQFVGLWVDSEEPVADVEAPWAHLDVRDGWQSPVRADEEQVLLMTTCMETLLVADRAALRRHYGGRLREAALPPLHALEARDRKDVLDRLQRATEDCSNAYKKGERSFRVLAEVDPVTLSEQLPSFARTQRILDEKL